MLRRLTVVATPFVLFPAVAGAQTLDFDPVAGWLARVEQETRFSGVVLVVRGAEVLLHEGYGLADDERGTPMTPETVVLTGSISKQFTAALILHLDATGLLDLEDSIAEHIGGVPSDKRAITIHHLLSHTAGFTRDHFDDDLTPMTEEEALQAIFALELGFPPGSDYAYSNTGYALLAVIAQEVTGRPFLDLVREDLFDRFGLEATGFFSDEWSGHAVATAYRNGVSQGPPSEFPGPFWGNMGNGGVMSTAADLHAWFTSLRAGEVLPPEQTRLLFAPHATVREGERYGYGWFLAETELGPRISHGGVGLGGNSELAHFPERDLTIIVLSNRARFVWAGGDWVDVWLPAREVLNRLVANLAAADFSALPERTRVPAATWTVYARAAILIALALALGLFVRAARRRRSPRSP